MKDINNKINNLKEKIEGIKEEQYKELFEVDNSAIHTP